MNRYDDPILTEEEIRDAESKTVDEVLEEGVYVIIDIAYQNGLTDATIDAVLERVLAKRQAPRFKVLD